MSPDVLLFGEAELFTLSLGSDTSLWLVSRRVAGWGCDWGCCLAVLTWSLEGGWLCTASSSSDSRRSRRALISEWLDWPLLWLEECLWTRLADDWADGGDRLSCW